YDYQKPGFDASSREEAPKSTQREVYVHPADFAGTSDGKQRAKRSLEQLRTLTKTIRAGSDCIRLEAGRRLTLEGAARGSLNAEYVITNVRHTAKLGEGHGGDEVLDYQNQFEGIPKDLPYRPPLLPPPPPHGIDVAFVVCPQGGEIHSDEW